MHSEKSWRQALLLSALIHGILLVGIGWLSVFASIPQPSQDYIEIDLVSETAVSVREESAMGNSSTLSAVPNVQTSAAPISGEAAGKVVNRSDGDGQTATTGTSPGLKPPGSPPDAAMTETSGSQRSILLAPRILHKIEPVYPEQARLQGWEGKVTLKLEVMTDGLVGNVSIVSSSGYAILDDAAAQAVQQWRFVPAKNAANDMAVRCLTTVALVFKLN
jgi:periplasmic protein TonB